MTKYREIIRLTGLGFSQRNIMASCGVTQKTVVKVQKRARELNLSWPLDESMTDAELQRLMFPKESTISKNKRMPDYDYIRKELIRNGVSKKLLWTEYMEDCRANGDEPLMYFQFCYHIQQDEQKRRATMHINRKPGEQVEVDWAGDSATIIAPDTGEILKAWRITFGYGRFWKLIPEFMEPFIQSRFTVIISRLIRKECCPVRVCISDNAVVSIEQIQHVIADENNTGFPAFGFPDKKIFPVERSISLVRKSLASEALRPQV